MKRIIFLLLLFAASAAPCWAQFADTADLNTYIRENIRDKRPDKVTADQLQRALLGVAAQASRVPDTIRGREIISSGGLWGNKYKTNYLEVYDFPNGGGIRLNRYTGNVNSGGSHYIEFFLDKSWGGRSIDFLSLNNIAYLQVLGNGNSNWSKFILSTYPAKSIEISPGNKAGLAVDSASQVIINGTAAPNKHKLSVLGSSYFRDALQIGDTSKLNLDTHKFYVKGSSKFSGDIIQATGRAVLGGASDDGTTPLQATGAKFSKLNLILDTPPTSSSDASGVPGDFLVGNDGYLYLKTAVGWVRFVSATF